MKNMKIWLLLMLVVMMVAVSGCAENVSKHSNPAPTPTTTSVNESTGFELTTQQHTPASQEHEKTVKVVATIDFGRQIILEKSLTWEKGLTAMGALKRVANVETAYGGGFVNGINGYVSKYTGGGGEKVDWFYTLNGFPAGRGARDYVLRVGDIQIWDYHEWTHYGRTCAVGAFPEPFVHGFNGVVRDTLIVYEKGAEQPAQNIAARLKEYGAKDVRVIPQDELTESEKEQCNLILVGTRALKPIDFLFGLHSRLNIYTYIEDGKVVMEDVRGNAKSLGKGGVIVATNSPWNPKGTGVNENIVWVVAGTSLDKVESVADVVCSTPEKLRYFYAAAVVDGKVMRVPQ
ncbi:MAG: DUF4430 domain-containing protein [Methermicoccaceae archaeon]